MKRQRGVVMKRQRGLGGNVNIIGLDRFGKMIN